MRLLIKNGRVIDPYSNKDELSDILVEDDKILKVAENIQEDSDEVLDAAGCFVMPGLIDLHVHLRDPGLEYKENLETGSMAAAKGGFTTIVAMANTLPVIDSGDKISSIYEKAARLSPIHVLQAGAVTKGMLGEELADIASMAACGAAALSEDGKTVMDASLYQEGLRTAARYNLPVLDHCEDAELKGKGVMNECETSKKYGLPGILNEVEDRIIQRDIQLARETGAKLHICHCSTKGAVDLVRQGKEIGIHVTAEVCPHHFTLTSEEIPADDTNYKMAPPLRSREDVDALIKGLADGTIDAISTDHAPHAAHEKDKDWRKAAFGIVGLETAVALTITRLVEPGYLTPMMMAERMSTTPARILGIDKGSLQEGKSADIVIIDPSRSYKIDKNTFFSKGRNTPFHGWDVKGKVKATICDGRIVYSDFLE